MTGYYFLMFTGITAVAGYYLVQAFAVLLVNPGAATSTKVHSMGIEGGIFVLFFLLAIQFAIIFAVDHRRK